MKKVLLLSILICCVLSISATKPSGYYITEEITLHVGQTLQINSHLTMEAGEYVSNCTSFNPGVATVSTGGLITAVAVGVADINVPVFNDDDPWGAISVFRITVVPSSGGGGGGTAPGGRI